MPTVINHPGTPGTTLYAGLPTPSVGGLITTLSLVNTSGSTQAANFVSPMLGMPFKAGDLPSGEYPVFTLEDDTPCPATIWGVTTWPDGSMKFCGAMLRVPTTIAGSGTLTIEVKGGGSAPSASSRGTGDFTAADLKTELTGVTNLSGVWTASLNTAITDATEVVVIGDGPAGKVYRVGGGFKQSGAAHGQVHGWHYAAALQDNAGGLLGLRYLGRIAQPWAEVTTPAVAQRVFTAVLKAGVTTIRTMQGYNSGGTLQANITLPHYTSVTTSGTNGQWDFIQGGGSSSADCTVRVVPDFDYMIETGLVSPYDRALSITPGVSVNYYPGADGGMRLDQGSTGERIDIGVFPTWVAQDVIAPTAATEQRIRVAAMASFGWRTCVRKNSTKQPPASTNPSASYTGLGTIETGWRLSGDVGQAGGMNLVGAAHRWVDDPSPGHRPATPYYAYLRTGEPQYLDQAVELAAANVTGLPVDTPNTWNTSTPVTAVKTGGFHSRDVIVAGTTYKGAGMFFRRDLLRLQAWGMREIAHAVALYPDTCPYGTEIKKYLSEVCEQNYAGINAYNAALPSTWRDAGFILFGTNEEENRESPWVVHYWANSIAHQAKILGSSAAFTAASHVANFYKSTFSAGGVAALGAYEMQMRRATGNQRIEAFSEALFRLYNVTLNYTASSATVTLTGTTPTAVANGSRFIVDVGAGASVVANEVFYVVGSSGLSFGLSRTLGGSAVTFTNTFTQAAPMAFITDPSPRYTYDQYGSAADDYICSAAAAATNLQRLGITGMSGAVTALRAQVVLGGVTFSEDPKNAYAI